MKKYFILSLILGILRIESVTGSTLDFPSRLTVKTTDKNLEQIIKVGQKNLEWLQYINKFRDQNNQISFSSKNKLYRFSIDSPTIYSPKIVTEEYSNVMQSIPSSLKSVLLEQTSMTAILPVSDYTFISWGQKVDYVYQYAVRWVNKEPYLEYLKNQKLFDMRGYYFLNRDSRIEQKLNQWLQLDYQSQVQIYEYLKQMCTNNQLKKCEDLINNAVATNTLYSFFLKLKPESQRLWDNFFKIQKIRPDGVLTNSSLEIPFLDPKNSKIKNFLIKNIPQVWSWGQWKVNLKFYVGGTDLPHIEFVPGALPHVDSVGGSSIVMDANTPIEEKSVQQIISHELGHILGFPDCYIEFYDEAQGAIVGYSLDLTNIMCSRDGEMQQIHYDELTSAYSRF